MARLLSAPTPAVLLLIALQLWSTKSQYAYHSASPYGPWKPVQVVAAGTAAGLTLPPGDIWYGPHCATKAANSSSLDPLSCGGNNPSPYFIDHEAAAATGFAPGTVIIGTTWSANQSYDGEPSRRRSSISVGICRNWSSACDIHPQTLFHFPHQNEWQNFSAIDKEGKYTQEVWNAWGYEDPFIYWDKHLQRWRALFHQYRKSGLRGGGAVGTWPSKGASTDPNIMSGGYAISKTTQLFGAWTIYPPSYGAGYSKVVNFTARSGESRLTWPTPEPPPASPPPPLPYVFGTTAAESGFRNDSMPSWGGNVVQGDDEQYHLFAAGFVGNCGIGAWEQNSQVIHAVGSSPGGPFRFADVALPTWHHNPDIKRCPVTGEYVLYTISCFAAAPDASNRCTNCHKNSCGPRRCRAGPGPRPGGVMTLQRRERPKLFLDRSGRATWLYNGVGLDAGARPFTMATPILDDVPENYPRRLAAQ